MKNDYIFNQYECPHCYSREIKQIPQEWTDKLIVSYYEDFYFCINCGLHIKFKSPEEKSYA